MYNLSKSMNIGEFLAITKQQYADLLIATKIASESDRATIEKRLQSFCHGRFSDDLGSAQAEVRTEQVGGRKEAVLYVSRALVSAFENAKDANAPELDKLRQTLFHEATHVLQLNDQMDENVGYITPKREGYGANEAAAEMAEQLVMVEYLKSIRGLKNAGLVGVTAHEHGLDFQAVQVVPDTTTHDRTKAIRAGSYFREVSVLRGALKKMGAQETEFIRDSFGFKQQERERFAAEFSERVCDFDQFNTDLTSMLVFERQNADDALVSLDEYKEAASRAR